MGLFVISDRHFFFKFIETLLQKDKMKANATALSPCPQDNERMEELIYESKTSFSGLCRAGGYGYLASVRKLVV